MGKSINNLFYMDDLKLFARNYDELMGIGCCENDNDDIGM